MRILAIETSCDDTSVAIVEDGSKVLSSIVSSQAELHSEFGGVVPEVAAREHIKNMLPVLDEALTESETSLDEIDNIVVTQGPGLIGSLIVGVNTARALSIIYKKPLTALHHTEGHIYANWLADNLPEGKKPPIFPLVCLTVSGGHSNIIYMRDHLRYEVIGETQDDAAGEAFDKVAKMLGLGYPGGPIISKYSMHGDSEAYSFPRVDLTPPPRRNDEGYLEKAPQSIDFSFSGLKTAVLKEVKNIDNPSLADKENISASFQAAANEILTRNLIRAVGEKRPASVLLSGGVAANKDLKEMISGAIKKEGIPFYHPKPRYCTDNAAMMAAAGYWHIAKKRFHDPYRLVPEPNLRLT
jgi:N6-L-threonylcarbamoyladenine synthase